MSRALFRLGASMIAVAALCTNALAQAAPGDITTIVVTARTPVGQVMYFAGGTRTVTVTVHVHPPGSSFGVDVTASVDINSGEQTRAEVAQDLADGLKSDLLSKGITSAGNLVSVRGGTVTVAATPPGEGPGNSGTLANPVRSPDDDDNKPTTRSSTRGAE